MINWEKGLTEAQKELLTKLLNEEKNIPFKYYLIIYGNNTRKVFGRLLPKNKLIRERESGYTYYLEIDNKVQPFSTFEYTIIEAKEDN